jgi:hypothetical protein
MGAKIDKKQRELTAFARLPEGPPAHTMSGGP